MRVLSAPTTKVQHGKRLMPWTAPVVLTPVANLDFIRFFSSCRPYRPQRHPNYVSGDAPVDRTICREEAAFAGKVTCGVQNETSGQSWPSNTVATDAFYQTVTDHMISSLKAGVDRAHHTLSQNDKPFGLLCCAALVRRLRSEIVHSVRCGLEITTLNLVYKACNCGVHGYRHTGRAA